MEAVLQVQTILKPHSKTMKPYSQILKPISSKKYNVFTQKLVQLVKNSGEHCLTIISQV